jgi:imidazoleglycerol phosphate dehydratase HisB
MSENSAFDSYSTLLIDPVDTIISNEREGEFTPRAITTLARISARLEYTLAVLPQDRVDVSAMVYDRVIRLLAREGINLRSQELDSADKGTLFLTSDLKKIPQALGVCSEVIIFGNKHSVEGVYCASDWLNVETFLANRGRLARVKRKTKETDIDISLELDGTGQCSVSTGLKFFDHMLEQIAKHSWCDLVIDVKGDLEVDEHHTIEDTGIALGEAYAIALRNKIGLNRYGFTLPMDDCLAQVALDFGGRSWLVWNAQFKREKIGDCPTEMFYHFFKSFSDAAKCNINIKAEGENEHHKIESIFKAMARALRQAVYVDPYKQVLPSSKGVIC